MTLELEIDVPESRTVTLTLPPEVPVGRLRLTLQPPADIPPPPKGISEKALRERAAFFRLLPELLKTQRGKVVAIHDEQVVAIGDERRALIEAARKIAGSVDLHVAHVLEKQPMERLPSIREIRGSSS